jgi:predicted acyltransferase (DUF342 family)
VKAEDDARISGSTKIGRDLIVDDDLKTSGTLKVGGSLIADDDVKISGSTKISGDTKVGEFLKISGSFYCEKNINAEHGCKLTGSVKVDQNLDTNGLANLKSKTRVGGNVTGVDIFFDKYKWYHFWYWFGRASLFFFKYFRIFYEIGGNVSAKNIIDITRSHVKGDLKARKVIIRRWTQVDGNVYFVDDCFIHRKAKLAYEPVRINKEEL